MDITDKERIKKALLESGLASIMIDNMIEDLTRACEPQCSESCKQCEAGCAGCCKTGTANRSSSQREIEAVQE